MPVTTSQTPRGLVSRLRGGARIAAMVVAASLGAACSPQKTPAPPAARPDIILITVDSLRADHVGAYGYHRPTSPAIDAFAKESVVVRDHIAQAPYTKASIASLFTGLYPTAHKASTTSITFAEAMTGHAEGELRVTDVLDSRVTTLAERLAAAGYHTVGLTTNPFLIADFGFAQGFATYEFLAGAGGDFVRAPDVVRHAIEAIEARPAGEPLFLWLHMMEPHSPYSAPDKFVSMFPVAGPPRPIDPGIIPPWILIDGSTDLNLYLARYDAEIRAADEAIGSLFAHLKMKGLWDTSAIVLTADHGEEFMDHGAMDHNRTLYDEMLRVPLIVRAPGLGAGVVDQQTQSVDLAPTLARLGGAKAAREEFQGADIGPVLSREANGEPYAYAEIVGRRFALRSREWKFISSLQGGKQLFDLGKDPQERENLARTDPATAAKLETTLARIVAASINAGEHIQGQFAPIPKEVLERLRALGYVR